MTYSHTLNEELLYFPETGIVLPKRETDEITKKVREMRRKDNKIPQEIEKTPQQIKNEVEKEYVIRHNHFVSPRNQYSVFYRVNNKIIVFSSIKKAQKIAKHCGGTIYLKNGGIKHKNLIPIGTYSNWHYKGYHKLR